jgi:hypothetical protein
VVTAPASTDPFRWWHAGGWRTPERVDTIYRGDEWVAVFLRRLDDELAKLKSRLTQVRLEPDRRALVATGAADGAGEEVLRTALGTYRDVLLFHPALHPAVESGVSAAVTAAALDCRNRGFHQAEAIREGGRERLLAEPGLLLHRDVAEGLRRLGVSGLPPMGVSGVIGLDTPDGEYLLASLRSDEVAVNPGCLGPTIDGGLNWSTGSADPATGLWHEIKDELPGFLDAVELVGTLLPPVDPTFLGERATSRCGVNVVYEATIAMAPDELFRRLTGHFETKELVLIEAARPAAGAAAPFPRVLRHDGDGLVELTRAHPISEVLAAALARRGLVDVTNPPPPHREARPMSTTVKLPDITLEDQWAEDLIERHSRLNRMLTIETLVDLAESGPPTKLEDLQPIFDAVREWEFVRNTGRLKAADDARLFEALVYRVGRYLFMNNERRALAGHDLMLPRNKAEALEQGLDPNPIGSYYTLRLEEVAKADTDEDPEGVWLGEVSDALSALNRNEAVQEYAEVARRGRLLCFCAALWALENKRGASAAGLALDEGYRKSLSGDVIALFFRSRALLVSPVISAAQAQLGLQFVTTALATYDRNPGMHHTKAIFLFRQSALTEIESVSVNCLQEALSSVETALLWDAEFAKFYFTRARIKYRLKDRAGALIDLRAAIELARYSESSIVVQREVAEWESLLDNWQGSPLGDFTL